jgi:hypothetical protein
VTTALQVARRLVDLAEEGCAIAAAGRLDELDGQQAAWDAAVAALRDHRDRRAPQVLALLDRARELQGEQAAILAAARSEVAAELGRLRRTRTGAQGYAAAGLAGPAGGLSASA